MEIFIGNKTANISEEKIFGMFRATFIVHAFLILETLTLGVLEISVIYGIYIICLYLIMKNMGKNILKKNIKKLYVITNISPLILNLITVFLITENIGGTISTLLSSVFFYKVK